MRIYFLSILSIIIFSCSSNAQMFSTKQDSLRGTLNANRSWWDVTFYNLTVTPNIKDETIEGKNIIHFKVITSGKMMQIDLQEPLKITSVLYNNTALKYIRDGNIYLVQFTAAPKIGTTQKIEINYKGKPRKAIRAPWDGGIVWEKDKKGRPFINTACQGLGASVWWPCKDHQSDEPDSMQTHYIVPKDLKETKLMYGL
jgi:aminopeptidase N